MSSDDDRSLHQDSEQNDVKKKAKRGIIYLATIPPYMNVTKIREIFSEFGTVGRVYMQLAETDTKHNQNGKIKRKKFVKKFTEGWIEYEKKYVAKKVAAILNNKQVNTRKKSKHYDCIWNVKYLSNFKWTHLHERLAYEKAARRQKLRAEIALAKKQTNFFTINIDKHKKNKTFVNKDLVKTKDEQPPIEVGKVNDSVNSEERKEFFKSLFNS